MTAATDNLPSEASPASFSPPPPHARHLACTPHSSDRPDARRSTRTGPRRGSLLAVLTLAGLLAACSPRQLLVQGVADALATQGQADEEDLALARDASPFYLKLSESLLKESPGNLKLAQSVASGFTQYAYAFVASEAERLAATDAKQAHALNERARHMYLRAHRHAMTALELSAPGFTARLMQPTAPRMRCCCGPSRWGWLTGRRHRGARPLPCRKTTRTPWPICPPWCAWPPGPPTPTPPTATVRWPA